MPIHDGPDRPAAALARPPAVPRRATSRTRPSGLRPLEAVAAAAGAVAVLLACTGVTFGAYTAVTSADESTFSSGSVSISDDDGGAALFDLSAIAGTTDEGCIGVTYGGSLPARIVQDATVTGTLGTYLRLRVLRGTGTTGGGDCSGFVPDDADHVGAGRGVVYDGTLAAYATAADPLASGPTWAPGTTRTYRFVVELGSDTAAEGRTASARFRWSAQST